MNFYGFCYQYLLNQTKDILTKEEIDAFINEVDVPNISSMNDIYRMLIIVLQDYQSMPNVINFKLRQKEISRILHNFDVHVVSAMSYEEIYLSFKENFKLNILNENRNSWLKFSKGVYDSAVFLSKFNNIDEFNNFIKTFQLNVHTKLALPLLLSTEIYGLGFALACNWLKELGYRDYPKPDVHMIDVFQSIGLCDNNQMSCYKAMVKVAEDCKIDAYSLDKVIWLICSGNYYRYNKKSKKSPKQLKSEFIKELVARIKQ